MLLYFWSAGCTTCRGENPRLVEMYNTYKAKGFEIYAANLDKNKENWKKAAAQDKVKWLTVLDSKGFEGEIPSTYGVQYTPNNYLLNPAGEIIGKDLRGNDLP